MFSRCERRASGIALLQWDRRLRMGLDQARTLHRAPEQGAPNAGPATCPRVPCNSMRRILSTNRLFVNKTPTIFVGFNENCCSDGLLSILDCFSRRDSHLRGPV